MNLNNYSVEEQEGPTKTYPLTRVSKKVALEYIKKNDLSDKNKSGYPIYRSLKEEQAIVAIVQDDNVPPFHLFNFFEPGELGGKRVFNSLSGNTLEAYCHDEKRTIVNIESEKLKRLEIQYYQKCKAYSSKLDFVEKQISPIRKAIHNRFVKSLYNIFEQHDFLRVRKGAILLENEWNSVYFDMQITWVTRVDAVRREYNSLFSPKSRIEVGIKVVINSIFGSYIKNIKEITDTQFAVTVVEREDRIYTETLFLIELNN